MSIKRPFIIYVILLLLVFESVYTYWFAYKYGDYFDYMWATIFVVSAISLFLNKIWSKYLLYLITISFIIFLIYVSIPAIKEVMGYSTGLLDLCISLIPGALMILVCVGSSIVVTKYLDNFKKK